MFTHVVFFRMKDSNEARIEQARQLLDGLRTEIPEIKGLELGADVVRSVRSFDFCIIERFEDRQAMERYQVHPAHQAVLKKLGELVVESASVDFES